MTEELKISSRDPNFCKEVASDDVSQVPVVFQF